jgi:hypothetical protein
MSQQPSAETVWEAACLRDKVILVWNRKPGTPYRMDVAAARCPNCGGALDQRKGYISRRVRVTRQQIRLT